MSDEILGIDLGTTNSLVGVVDSGFPILLADAEGSRITPSAVYFPPEEGAAPLVGAAALRMRRMHPERTVTSVKRLMGRRCGELESLPPYPIAGKAEDPVRILAGGQTHSPESISALILGHLRAVAERALDKPVRRAVITVPAYFNDAQRNATKRAGELAGLTVERILNEPTAAALAYGLDKLEEKSRVAVYDLGGGTFDISILELNDGLFRVLATNGDTQLGGDDFDEALAECLWEANPHSDGALAAAGRNARAAFLQAARTAKETLSSQETAPVRLPFYDGAHSFETTLSRDTLNRLCRPLLQRTRRHCLQSLADAGLDAADLDSVVLVGGSTRIPLVREFAADLFGQAPNTTQNPDETVGLGSAAQGGILSGTLQNMVLLDVTPLSLGIETFGGLMNVIIPRNTTIPAKAGEMFTNAMPNQPSMRVRVLQGEREMARDNWELGQCSVPFSPGPKGSARVGVQFEIDADGILNVLARDTHTQTDTLLKIENSAVDVHDAKVEEMIAESVEFAFADMNERIWTEAKLKSDELLPAVEAGLENVGGDLDPENIAEIQSAVEAVRAALKGEDAQQLKRANRRLDEATEEMAALLVEKAMEASLRRKGILD